MKIIERIPFHLDPDEVARLLRFDPGRSGFEGLDDLIAFARDRADLKAVYEISYVGEKSPDSVEIGGVVFRSCVLRQNLENVQKVFPYIVTIGPELELAAGSSGDLLRQYYLEEVANAILEIGASWLAERLKKRWGLPRLSSMSPGSLADWPITEQAKLFSLFGDTKKIIGVTLSESMLMLPRKSISGIFFPSEEGFISCRLCPREICPSRQAPYDASLAAKYEASGNSSD